MKKYWYIVIGLSLVSLIASCSSGSESSFTKNYPNISSSANETRIQNDNQSLENNSSWLEGTCWVYSLGDDKVKTEYTIYLKKNNQFYGTAKTNAKSFALHEIKAESESFGEWSQEGKIITTIENNKTFRYEIISKGELQLLGTSRMSYYRCQNN